ncbi:MAG TPA: FtsX-like permease family protein [Polyangiaceae bacterium]|jgi:hypothetical protein
MIGMLGTVGLVLAFALSFTSAARAQPMPRDAAPQATPDKQFMLDLEALTRAPHRLAGSEAGRAASDYVQARLRDIGIQQLFELDVQVWQSRTIRCSLELDGVSVPLLPLRPDLMALPVTPAEGIRADTLYVAGGEPADYGARSPAGKIVVLDYDSASNWQRAFAWGARAVIFLGRDGESPRAAKHVDLPVNLPRFYAEPSVLAIADLRVDHTNTQLLSEVRWERGVGRNLIARIPGTAPAFAGEHAEQEALVLSAHFDSYGVVPERSAGARGAANVAALLEAAARFQEKPAKRDVIFMFLDADAWAHQGAREVYDAWLMPDDQAHKQIDEHAKELADTSAIAGLLGREHLSVQGAGASVETVRALKRDLSDEADFAHDDSHKQLEVLRLHSAPTASMRAQMAELAERTQSWDDLRRALHQDTLAGFVAEHAGAPMFRSIFSELERRLGQRLAARALELKDLIAIDQQRERLRAGLGRKDSSGSHPDWVALHVAFDFSDRGATWGPVVGDWGNRLFAFRSPKSDGDLPGYYGRILGALREASRSGPALSGLAAHTLDDPSLGLSFAPEPFVSEASVAGSYGIYELTLMTGYDARERDGQPSDDLAALDAGALRRQALAGSELLARAADSAELSLPRVFHAYARSKYPSFSHGQSQGDYAGLSVSGTLSEDRPAANAMVALWPGNKSWANSAWLTRQNSAQLPGYEPTALEVVDQHGRYRAIGLREDLFTEAMTIAATFDDRGAIVGISAQEQQAHKFSEAMRVNISTGPGYAWTSLQTDETDPALLKVMKASSDAPFRDNRSLWGELGSFGFLYVSDQVPDYRLKIFQPKGPSLLGPPTASAPYGTGIEPRRLEPGLRLSELTARDLWELNERRLAQLRARGVTSADLELLHARAKRALDRASRESDTPRAEAVRLQSAALSGRVYGPLRSSMDDLVHAVVALLLLAIPFAFSLERLLLGASTIYGRIAGFAACFLTTFGVLYLIHPGFAIASTPVIVFLAFAIVLLAGLVTYIVMRKFSSELKAIQGHAGRAHTLEVSRAGTTLAAIGMGVSTMRRRPMRTMLTALTVTMLTFTILCFASFSRTVGVRAVYEGPLSAQTPSSALLRKLDYSELVPGALEILQGLEGNGGLLAAQYWLVPKDATAPHFSIARVDTGEAFTVDALMSVSPEELKRFPELSAALGDGGLAAELAALSRGEVFLPATTAQLLKLKPGDELALNGHLTRLAGTLSASKLQRLRNLDGQSLLPVDFQDAATLAQGSQATPSAQSGATPTVDETDRSFVHLSSEQVVLGSSDFVRGLGGTLRAISIYGGQGVEPAALGRRLAEITGLPVWAAGSQGVERLIFTVLSDVSGGFALFVPLLLGGLIVFGTLLGSIADREREIFTFSALGLAPAHVGLLFFAEAAVYAVVGGMGGQILAELVGLLAAQLARAGRIEPVSINYSSTNSLVAIGIVMSTVLVSAAYPALRASRAANPGLSRAFRIPKPEGDRLSLIFPFTVSAYDITGVVSYLAEHFRNHDDAGLGDFAASNVALRKTDAGSIELCADLAVAPFDLGVTQHLILTALPSSIPGVDEISLSLERTSGTRDDWYRQNRVFLRGLREQFLLWRTLSVDSVEAYRLVTLQALGEAGSTAA